MTTYAITGSTGHFGRHALAELLGAGVAPGDIVAVARDEKKATAAAASGVQVRVADYDDPDSMDRAFGGVDRLLFVSANDVAARDRQHANVVAAALAAGVGHVFYTSILAADRSPMMLAKQHAATEQLLCASGLAWTFLRNGWYIENYEASLAPAIEHGALLGAGGDGTFAPASRHDYAAAAVAALRADDQAGVVHELGGDERVTLSDLAGIIERVSGHDVSYADMSPDAYAAQLGEIGVPDDFAQVLADSDAGLADGWLDTTSGDLARLLGRPTTPIADVLTPTIAQIELELDD